jgi:uncharacterized protein (TIGR02996 family)
MNPTLAGLLQACKDEPSDDPLRLILADWLEENGDPDRAALIRAQLPLADRWCEVTEVGEPSVRNRFLLRDHADRWLGPARQWYSRAELSRGMIRIQATAEQLRDHPPGELPAEIIPWLESLCLWRADGPCDWVLGSEPIRFFSCVAVAGSAFALPAVVDREIRQLTSNPAAGNLRRLRLVRAEIWAEAGEMLARCEHLAGLRELVLEEYRFDAAAEALATAPWLAGLTRLDLGPVRSSPEAVTTLLSAGLERLTHLGLRHAPLYAPVARALAEKPGLPSVTTLDLDDAEPSQTAVAILAASPVLRPIRLSARRLPINTEGVAALAAGRLLERVERLDLEGNGLDEADSLRLLRSGQWTALRSLSLHAPLGDAGCDVLGSGAFPSLAHLTLIGAGIGPEGCRTLARSAHLGMLRSLNLWANPIGPAGARHLAEGSALAGVTSLNLSSTRLQTRGVAALVGSGFAGRMKSLSLGLNGLGDPTATALGRLGADAQLTDLGLGRNRIGPAGAAALAGCAGLAQLRHLGLSDNRIGDKGVLALLGSAYLGALVELNVERNDVTRVGAEALRDWPQRARMLAIRAYQHGLPPELWSQIDIQRG